MMNQKLKEIIQKSGNNLHMRVVEFFENQGWEVDLSSYYYDDTTVKPREIDIIASKQFDVGDHGGNRVGSFAVHLFIECKYFKNDIAFRMHQAKEDDMREAMIFNGFNRAEVLNVPNAQHHYLDELRIAKLYDAVQDEQNQIFDAITKPAKALIFFKEHKPIQGIFYPIVVYEGISGFYLLNRESEIKELDNLKPSQYAIFGLNYSYKSLGNELKKQYLCVEFVSIKKLEDYLKLIYIKEIETLQGYIRLQGLKKKIRSLSP